MMGGISFLQHFAAIFALRPRGRECTFFSPRWRRVRRHRWLGAAGDARSLPPRRSLHHLSACIGVSRINTIVMLPHPHYHPPPPGSDRFVTFCSFLRCEHMAELSGQSTGAALRRRQRRLRSVVATRAAVDRCSPCQCPPPQL